MSCADRPRKEKEGEAFAFVTLDDLEKEIERAKTEAKIEVLEEVLEMGEMVIDMNYWQQTMVAVSDIEEMLSTLKKKKF